MKRATEPRPFRFTQAQYYDMYERGWFNDYRIELLDGEIWEVPPQSNYQAATIALCQDALRACFPDCWVRVRGPLDLGPYSLPEPDLAVVAGSARQPRGHPTAAYLVVEVKELSLERDLLIKAGLYAAARIADYWLVDLVGR